VREGEAVVSIRGEKDIMGKIISQLPAPIGPDGQELSAEEIERINAEPTYVPVDLDRHGKIVTFFVAADFDQVEKESDQAYQLLKADEYKILVDDRKKSRAAAKTDDDGESNELSGDQNRKLIELRPKQREVFANLVFPAILGGNVPGMPQLDGVEGKRELRVFLDSGSKTSRAVLEALVMAYDPTGPLAQGRKMQQSSQRLIEQLESKVMERMEKVLAEARAAPETEMEAETDSPKLATTATATSSETPTATKAPTPPDASSAPSPEVTAAASPAASTPIAKV
jgi:hypothetical protein